MGFQWANVKGMRAWTALDLAAATAKVGVGFRQMYWMIMIC